MRFIPTDTSVFVTVLCAAALLVGPGSFHLAQGQSADKTPTAQERPRAETDLIQGGAGYFAVGLHAPGLQLPGRGAGRLVSIGGSGYGIVGERLLIGGAGHRLFASRGGFQRDGASAGARYGLFTVGYLFRPTAQVRAYPQVGFGAGHLQVEVDEGTRHFEETLIDPGQGATYEKRSYLLRLGGGLEYRINSSGGGDLLVGLQIGYLFSPGESVDAHGNFADGLEASIQGPFVRVTFGGGS